MALCLLPRRQAYQNKWQEDGYTPKKHMYFPGAFFGFLLTSFIFNFLYLAGFLENGSFINYLALCTQSYYRSKIRPIFPKIEVVVSVLPIKQIPYYFRTSLQFPLFALSTWCKAKENLLLFISRMNNTLGDYTLQFSDQRYFLEWLIYYPILKKCHTKITTKSNVRLWWPVPLLLIDHIRPTRYLII
jgi:hypothetical protein